MRSRLWTRTVAVALLIGLGMLTAAFTIVGILVKSMSVVTTVVLALTQLATATIALFIPLSRKNEARRKMQGTMSQYVILQSLKADSSDKNRVINTMRELAPAARFHQEEIAGYLESTNLGERFAALASVQWQWRNDEAYNAMPFFTFGKTPRELPRPPKRRSRGYFPQLLEVLCRSWDQFENYHAMVAMWSMADSLGPKDKQELFKRVLDRSAGAPGHTCDRWGEFTEYLSGKRKSLTSSNG